MTEAKPEFIDSPYFVDEPGNWHLKPDAPDNLKKNLITICKPWKEKMYRAP
jgi:hypothetical protein